MFWLVFFVLLGLFAACGVLINVNRLRFAQSVEKDMRALFEAPPSKLPRLGSAELPPPVARYRDIAVGKRAPVRSLRLRHGGTFRLSPTSKVVPIRGTQLFAADPPGFVWTGRIRTFPGVWLDVRDRFVAGKGTMRVLLDDTITLVDAHGPSFDQGSALRLLAEMPWYPTALFDAGTVTWTALDANRARATLRFAGGEVSGVFEFGSDGLPTRFSAERFMDKDKLRTWMGVYRDFRSVSGMRVPFEAEVTWQLESGPYTYAHWNVDWMEYDEAPSGSDTQLSATQATRSSR